MAHAGGRPSKLTHALTQELAALVREVIYWEPAADALSIDRSTVWRWLKRGEREAAGPYYEFCNAVKKARALAEIDLLRAIRAGEDGWQSRAWIAERAFSERWGRKERVDVIQTVRVMAQHAGLDDQETAAAVSEAERYLKETRGAVAR